MRVVTRKSAWGLLLLAAFCWGVGNVANKTVLIHLQPLSVVGLRCLLAAVVIAPLALADFRKGDAGPWIKSAVRVAVLFAVALVLQQLAYLSTTVTNASFLISTATIMTPILAWAVLNHRPGVTVACAAPLTLIGAFLMAGVSLSRLSFNTGDALCIASALFYAAWMVALGQHAAAYGRPLGSAMVQFVVGAVLVLPFAVVVEAPSLGAVRLALPELILLGVVSTALAFGLQTWAQRFVAASTASILVSAESLFGAAGAYLLLNEQTPLRGLTGAGLILLAIVLVALGDKALPPHRPVDHGATAPAVK